jgi:hypothetical protein
MSEHNILHRGAHWENDSRPVLSKLLSASFSGYLRIISLILVILAVTGIMVKLTVSA